MKAFVGYHTITGNTKKIADVIFESLECEKDIEKLSLSEELKAGFDIYFLGFPTMNMGPDGLVTDFLNNKVKGKKIALFVTHGSTKESPKLKNWMEKFVNAVKDAEFLGMFECEGKISEAAFKFVKKTGEPEFLKWDESYITKDKPNQEDFEKAKEFARDVLSKA
jgi:flavodoxin